MNILHLKYNQILRLSRAGKWDQEVLMVCHNGKGEFSFYEAGNNQNQFWGTNGWLKEPNLIHLQSKVDLAIEREWMMVFCDRPPVTTTPEEDEA